MSNNSNRSVKDDTNAFSELITAVRGKIKKFLFSFLKKKLLKQIFLF
jgi:hypothetical protein